MPRNRRRFLALAGGTLAAGGLAALAGCSSSCPDGDRPEPERTVSMWGEQVGSFDEPPRGAWPTSHGNAARTGYASGSLPGVDPAVRWRTDLDLPSTDRGGTSASEPTVGGGTVLVADDERVHALSLATGELRWRSGRISPTYHDTLYEHEANTVAPTAGPDGTVYAGTTSGLVALDGTEGTLRWEFDDLTDVSSPAVVDGTVFARGATSLAAVAPSGEAIWRRPVSRGDRPVPPAVGDAAVVVTTADGLRAFDPATGDERWSWDGRAESHVVVEGGTCYVGNYEGLHALDEGTGEERWTFDRGDYRALLSPVITPDTVYVVEQPGEAGAASFALQRTDRAPEPRWCSYVGEGAVTAATDDLALSVLPIGTGPDASQGIVAFSESLGQVRWAVEAGSSPSDWVTPPAVVDGAFVATTRDGTAVAFGPGADDG